MKFCCKRFIIVSYEKKMDVTQQEESMELLTLYLIDDEAIILKGLLETYDWNKMGFQVIGWARDGEEALPDIIEKRPDVVLTDVRMKKMSGLTLIEKAKEQNIETNFVVISAYRDFEYAKKACANGALSYLVKPIDDEELEKTMSEIYQKCTEKKFKEKQYSLWEKILLEDKDNFLNQMVAKYLEGMVEERELEELAVSLQRQDMITNDFVVAAVGIDIAQRIFNQKEFNMKQYLLETELYKKLKESYKVWTKKLQDETICFVIDLGKEKKTASLKILLKNLQEEMKGDMVSALSGVGTGIAGMKHAYDHALELYEIAAEAGAGILLMDNKISLKSVPKYSTDMESQMISALRKGDKEQLKKAFEKFLYVLPESEHFIRIYLRRLAVRIEFAIEESWGLTESLQQSFHNFYETVDSVAITKIVSILYQLFLRIIEWKSTAPKLVSDRYFQEYIPVAIAYIQEHLQNENLSITEVSEYVYLNPVYFGRLFKNEVKMSFKRYVQNMRMEKAKELLIDHEYNISEICDKVGIPNPSYFSQLFKQYTGILPSEYKRSREV